MIDLRLGDCLDVMRGIPDASIDAVITDPPYGINYINGGGRNPKNGWRDFRTHGDWDKQRPTREYFDEMRRVAKTLIIWGGNYFADVLPVSSQWLIWDKGQRDFSLADCELAWSSQGKAARIFTFARASMHKENGLHPTQKPIALMEWCISKIIKDCDTILDPFMGSGTTGVACVKLNRSFIGIEINPQYFQIAQRRIQEAQAQMAMPMVTA